MYLLISQGFKGECILGETDVRTNSREGSGTKRTWAGPGRTGRDLLGGRKGE